MQLSHGLFEKLAIWKPSTSKRSIQYAGTYTISISIQLERHQNINYQQLVKSVFWLWNYASNLSRVVHDQRSSWIPHQGPSPKGIYPPRENWKDTRAEKHLSLGAQSWCSCLAGSFSSLWGSNTAHQRSLCWMHPLPPWDTYSHRIMLVATPRSSCQNVEGYKGPSCIETRPYLVEDIFGEVRHVALAGHRAIIIIPEVLLQSYWVVGDGQDCAQVMGQHLGNTSLNASTHRMYVFMCVYILVRVG